MKFVDDFVVVRIVLEAAAGINRARDAKTIQFPEEAARRVELILPRKLWPVEQSRIEDVGVRFGDENSRWIATFVPLDFAGRRIRRVLGVSHGAQSGTVQ